MLHPRALEGGHPAVEELEFLFQAARAWDPAVPVGSAGPFYGEAYRPASFIWVYLLVFNADSTLLASGSHSRKVRVYEIGDGAPCEEHERLQPGIHHPRHRAIKLALSKTTTIIHCGTLERIPTDPRRFPGAEERRRCSEALPQTPCNQSGAYDDFTPCPAPHGAQSSDGCRSPANSKNHTTRHG